MRNKYLYGILVFCVFFSFLSVKRLSFIIAEKSSSYIAPGDQLALAEGDKEASRIDKYNPLYRLNIGCCYAHVDSIDSNSIPQLFKGKKSYFHHLDSITKYLEEAYFMFPDEPVFALNYSITELLKGNTKQSIKVLEPFLDVEDNSLELLCILGLEYEIEGQYEKATELYAQALSYFPELSRSDFLKDLRDRDSILTAIVFKKAVTKLKIQYEKTEDPIVASKIGSLMYEMGDWNQAEMYLNKALSDLPSLNRPWYYLGLIWENRGDDETALSYYMKSYKLDKNDILPLKKLVLYGVLEPTLLDNTRQIKTSKQSYRLVRVFGGKVVRFPFILTDLEYYCRTNDAGMI